MFIFSEDSEEYRQETLPWKRQMRGTSKRTSNAGRNSVACGIVNDLRYLSNHQGHSYSNDKDIGATKYKVILQN